MFTGIEAKAQCQTGYTPRTLNIEVNGCTYQVNVCVKCVTGPTPGEIKIRDITQIVTEPACEQEWSFQEVLNYINNHISTFDFMNTYLCLSITAPPCPGQSNVYTFYHWVCYNIELISYFGEDHIVYRPCDYDNYCVESFTYCFQSIPPPGYFSKTRVSGPTMVGSVNCTLEAWEVDIPDEYNTTTECYIYHTLCNPPD